MTNENNKIAAANSMQLTYSSIQQRGVAVKKVNFSDQDIIRDTLETTDRDSNHMFFTAKSDFEQAGGDVESGQRLDLLG